MNRQSFGSSLCALAIIGSTGALLGTVGHHQRLAAPGVKTSSLPGSIRLRAELPEKVLDYQSTEMSFDNSTLGLLPPDTSLGWRRYRAPDGFTTDLRVVLMGSDRTSLHKPQFCLTGQGWRIDDFASAETTIRVDKPLPYDLPVIKLFAKTTTTIDGHSQPISGVYVYWYVADNGLSGSALGLERMWSMASQLARTGVLQRWAYVSCFAACLPGQETAVYERLKQFIPAAVPQFQLYPRSQRVTASR